MLLSIALTSVRAQKVNTEMFYSQLQNYEISIDGKWVLIRKNYNEIRNNDSVYIVSTQNKKIIKRRNDNKITFLDKSLLCIESSSNRIEFLNLNNSKKIVLNKVNDFKLIKEHNLIFYLNTDNNTYNLSQIKKDNEKVIWSKHQDSIIYHELSQKNNILLVQDKTGLTTIDLKTLDKQTSKYTDLNINKTFWELNQSIVYLLDNNKKGSLLYSFDYSKNKIDSLDYSALKKSLDKVISIESIDNDKALVSYSSIVSEKSHDITQLEIWSTNDLNLERKSRDEEPLIRTIKYALFNFNTNQITSLDYLDNQIALVLDSEKIIYHNSNQYHDYTYYHRFADLNMYDIKNNTTSTIAKQIQNISGSLSISPNRNYIVFKKVKRHYLYNTITKSTIPINTSNTNQENLYWSEDSQRFYLSTDKGLYLYSPINNTLKTLIDSKNQVLEITPLNPIKQDFNPYKMSSKTLLNDNQILLLNRNHSNNTYAIELIKSQKTRTLVPFTKDRITSVISTDNFNSITYNTQNYNTPHTINLIQNNKSRILLKSNMLKELYNWRKQKIIEYTDIDGTPLKGILFYPKEFDKHKQYPMVTKIYQFQYYQSNEFFFPSMTNSDGFNIQTLLEKGYFVYLPDINDNDKGTGISALECVKQAIKEVTEKEKSIDKNRLGLMGHSHGGYKTNFIITQTDMFKAAVSGAGNSDIIRSYFSYNNNFSTPFYFQFETGQYNMPGSFKNHKQVYLDNSPILFVDQVKTPLLSWTGKHDENIQWEQTKEFFIGLQRNKVPHIALFYKNERHTILNKKSSEDLTTRIINWFDYFLKEKKNSQWITDGITFDKERMTPN